MPLNLIANPLGQYVFEPSDEEVKTAIGIMKTFEEILLDPDAQDGMERLYLGCAFDRVAFDDLGYDLKAPGSPAAVIEVDFETLSGGAFTEISPEDLHGLLFRGPESRKLKDSLILGLLWERDRVTNRDIDGIHLRSIQENLMEVREALHANCRVLLA